MSSVNPRPVAKSDLREDFRVGQSPQTMLLRFNRDQYPQKEALNIILEGTWKWKDLPEIEGKQMWKKASQ